MNRDLLKHQLGWSKLNERANEIRKQNKLDEIFESLALVGIGAIIAAIFFLTTKQ